MEQALTAKEVIGGSEFKCVLTHLEHSSNIDSEYSATKLSFLSQEETIIGVEIRLKFPDSLNFQDLFKKKEEKINWKKRLTGEQHV
jgi:hypothetical protein